MDGWMDRWIDRFKCKCYS